MVHLLEIKHWKPMKGKSFKEGLDIQILRAPENLQMKILYQKINRYK